MIHRKKKLNKTCQTFCHFNCKLFSAFPHTGLNFFFLIEFDGKVYSKIKDRKVFSKLASCSTMIKKELVNLSNPKNKHSCRTLNHSIVSH